MIVAQLSDIHATGSDEPLGLLGRVLAWLRPLAPDAIIISGDLAEEEHGRSYKAIRERLDAFGSPFYLVPGNVDDHGGLRQVFGDRFGWSDGTPLNVVGRVGQRLRLIGLDVTVRGSHHGDAEPALEWLAAELNRDGPPALIFQHQHPFHCGIDGKDRNMCQNAEALARVIQEARDPVLALTCGHVHRPMFTRFADRQATLCPSIARANRMKLDGRETSISDPPGLMLHHLQESRLVSHVVMVGS